MEWRNGRFEVMAPNGKLATQYTVESFAPNSIGIRRIEPAHSGDYGLTAVYKGTFTDGSETARGTVGFTWPGKPGYPHSTPWTATWGSELAQAHPPSQKKLLERADEEEAQARSAREQHAQRLSVGILGAMAAILGAGPQKTGASGGFTGGDPAATIRYLQSRVSQ
jgi:hypothetical protein